MRSPAWLQTLVTDSVPNRTLHSASVQKPYSVQTMDSDVMQKFVEYGRVCMAAQGSVRMCAQTDLRTCSQKRRSENQRLFPTWPCATRRCMNAKHGRRSGLHALPWRVEQAIC
jgi:hypothetical protein